MCLNGCVFMCVTKEWVRQIFNEVLHQKDCTLETWRKIRIKVIYKKGDVQDAGNYRPICTLPALYKLFSTPLYMRLYARLDQGQPADPGGFRRSHQTVDHLMVHRMLEQRCREWGIPLYISTIDFTKVSVGSCLGLVEEEHCEVAKESSRDTRNATWNGAHARATDGGTR